jgi:hypothetical protein
MKVNFVKTFIPVKDFVAEEKVGKKILVRFDAVENKETGAYSCVEGSVLASEYDEQELRKAYYAWKQKRAERVLKQAKDEKIAKIEAHDQSDAVNGFMLNGLLVWLDKATRVGLMNSTTIAKAAGQETTTLWLGGLKIVVDCDKAIQLLSALEMYALECFNVTASHKAAVNELRTIEEVEAYDYKAGYPKMLEMSV